MNRPFHVKKILPFLAFLTILSCGVAFAAAKVPVMSAAGRVLEISATSLKMERSVKGETEVMEFVVEYPLANIVVGEQIKVSYKKKEMQYILIRAKKAKKTAIGKPVKKHLERVLDGVVPQAKPPVE